MFEEQHIVKVTRKGKKLIKSGYDTCQFFADDRSCSVYEARSSVATGLDTGLPNCHRVAIGSPRQPWSTSPP